MNLLSGKTTLAEKIVAYSRVLFSLVLFIVGELQYFDPSNENNNYILQHQCISYGHRNID